MTMTTETTERKGPNIFKILKQFGPLLFLIVLMAVFTALKPSFIDPINVFNIMRQISITGLIALGMTFVILTAGIDLSIGSLLAFAGLVAAAVSKGGLSNRFTVGEGQDAAGYAWYLAALTAMAVGVVGGYLQGFAITRPNALSVGGWRPLWEKSAARADEVEQGLEDEIAGELAALEAGWPKALPTGVIHADLFPDNVFFPGDKLSGIIDFYFACTDFLAYDLAVCLNAWCFQPDLSFNVTKAKLMFESYRRLRPIPETEMQAMPLLARGAALRFLLTRLYDWLNHPPGAFVKPKDPMEYIRKLRFHQAARDIGAYGLK